MLPSPVPGFDDPLAILAACHEHILRKCRTLEKMAGHLSTLGLTPEAHAAAAEIRRYFATAGRHHHEDEEQDLFPLLRGDQSLTWLINSLVAEHQTMDQLWQQLEPMLARPETIRNPVNFTRLIGQFSALYTAHIETENRELIPRARALLPAEVLAVVGARMAARRGISL